VASHSNPGLRRGSFRVIRRPGSASSSVGSVASPSISPSTYHWVTRTAMWCLVGIVVTGAAVRLTGSGLGCSDWPNCEPGQLVPASEFHGWVEFGNRLITGFVSIAVIAAVSASLWRVPRNPRLTRWSLGLVAGVAGQIGLGAVTVLTHLSPPIVMGHFLLSIVLVWNAVVLHQLAEPAPHPRERAPRTVLRHCWGVATLASIVVFTGTIVTASGPNGGDEDVERLGVDLPDAARVHAVFVIALVITTLWLLQRLHVSDPAGLRRRVELLLVVMATQATVGYIQYFTEVPALLVAVHIALATVLWIAVVQLVFVARGGAAPADRDTAPTTGSRQSDFAQ
jgi:cytochrome c oxidase assembly protein subunit 15